MNLNYDTVKELIDANPEVAKKPMAQELLKVLQSGDTKSGEEMANNLLKTYGGTRSDIESKATSFFSNIVSRAGRR